MAENYHVVHSKELVPKPEYDGWYVVGDVTGEILDGPMERYAAEERAEEVNGPRSGPEPAEPTRRH
jgi:hypothetical protein